MSELKAYKMVNELYCTNRASVIPAEVYFKSDADKVIAALQDEIHNLKRSLLVARHEVAKARGKTSSYKSKTKLKEAK